MAKEKPNQNETISSYLLNLPESLKSQLEEIAKKERRTLRQQIQVFLEQGVKAYEGEGECPRL